MTSFTVDYLPKPQPSSHSFNLCTFPENLPPSSFFIPQIPPNPDQISFQLLGNKEKRILKAENPKFEYIGKNFGENSEKNQENRYLLGVLSESKKRMKLFDIDHIFNMKQSKKLKTDDEIYYKTGQSSKLNALEQKQMLVAEFGTKKSKKKLQQMLNNVVEVLLNIK